jgi:hypothetical protein
VATQRGDKLPINVDLTDRIIDVKVRLEELQPIRASCQSLFYNGIELADRKTVSQSNIRKNMFLYLEDHRNAKIRIFVKFPDGMTLPITVGLQATVADVKVAIQLQHGIPTSNQTLVLGGCDLNDARLLHPCGIWGQTTHYLVLRSP